MMRRLILLSFFWLLCAAWARVGGEELDPMPPLPASPFETRAARQKRIENQDELMVGVN